MRRMAGMIALICVLGFAIAARAERLKESTKLASHIVTGTVQKVFRRDGIGNKEYLVQIRIGNIEKGKGYKKGDLIFAYAFQRKPGVNLGPGPSGHTAVPKEGQRITARIKRENGEMEALYPDWFDVVKPLAKK